MSKKYRSGNDSHTKWKDWQEHQYDPGYWTGGNIPPILNENPKTKNFGRLYTVGAKVFGWVYIVASIASLIVMAKIVLWAIWGFLTISGSSYPVVNIFMGIIVLILASIIVSLYLAVGLKYLKQAEVRKKNLLIVVACTTVFFGYGILSEPLEASETWLKGKTGDPLIFRTEKRYPGTGFTCYIIDPTSKDEIARFWFQGKKKPVVTVRIDSTEIKIYDIGAGIIFKVGEGNYQAISFSSVSEGNLQTNHDLALVAKMLIDTKEWKWIKTFGPLLLSTSDQHVKDIFLRYADGQFSIEKLEINKYSQMTKEEMQGFAKETLRH